MKKKSLPKSVPTIGMVVLIAGLASILSVPVLGVVVAAALNVASVTMSYVYLAIAAVVFTLFQAYVLQKMVATDTEVAVTNLIVPFLSVILIMSAFTAIDTINEGVQPQLKQLSAEKRAQIESFLPDEMPNALLSSGMLYVIVNLLTAAIAFRKKEHKLLLWLLLLPVFYGAAINIGIYGARYVAAAIISSI